MNRHEFLNKLVLELGRLPRNEVEDILAYYNEYFDDAGPENEEAVLEELGSPVKIATQIKADYAVRQLDRMPPPGERSYGRPGDGRPYEGQDRGYGAGTGGYGSGSGAGTDPGQGTGSGPYVYQAPPQKRKGLSAVWWVILGIFAAPVALPVAIAAGALAIAVFIALGALALALLLCVAAFFIAGIVLIGAGIAILFVDFPSAMLGIGIGLATIGLMALLGCGVVVGAKALFRLIARKMNEKRQEKAAKKEVKFDE